MKTVDKEEWTVKMAPFFRIGTAPELSAHIDEVPSKTSKASPFDYYKPYLTLKSIYN